MLAAFAVEGGPALVLARGAADAALLSQFGALLALAWLAPPVLALIGEDAPAVTRRLARIAGLSIVVAALLTVGWLALQSAALAGSAADAPLVLRETVFGHLLLARLGLLGLAGLALARRWPWLATMLAGAAVATQAGHGHALAMYDEGPSWLLFSGVLHLLAAAAWLGGLLPLLVLVRAVPPREAALASARFSKLGTMCVLLLTGTALYQAFVLVGTPPGLIGTSYGLVALAKLGLFLGLLAFAARNRFRLTPALGGGAGKARRGLVRSIAAETVVGLLVVLAAGLLTSLPPAMHEQPLWPFPWRLSMEAVQENVSLRQEAMLAATVLAVAVIAATAAFVLRLRARWLVAVLAAVAAFIAAPHLDLLLAEAYPTQYWRSPTGFSSASIAEGAMLYPVHCAGCHGAEGRGDGPAAESLSVPPADLTAEHLWAHEDGELFWWLSRGIEAPGGGLAMPGFADTLTEDQRWALIDWVRANNAGTARTATGAWPLPVQAPGLQASCPDGRTVTLETLHGQVVRIVFGPATPASGVLTIQAASGPPAHPDVRLCVAGEEAVQRAYAAVTGLAAGDLAGTQMLVDGAGWLRALQQPGTAPGWNDPGLLAGAVRDIERHPLAEPSHNHAGMRM